MTTIDANLLRSRASALELACSVAVALPFLAAAATRPSGLTWLAVACSLAIAASAALHDMRRGVIPWRLAALVGAAPLLVAVARAAAGDRSTLDDVCTGVIVMGGPVMFLHSLAQRWFGFGDVLLASALGAVLGLVQPQAGFVALAVATAVALARTWERRVRELPFGGALVAGTAVVAWASIWVATS